MTEHAMVMESLWLEEAQQRWVALDYVPQDDLVRFCGEYIPAMIRSSTSDLKRVIVTIAWIGRTGVHWMQELLDWELPSLPEEGAIIVLCECMRREAQSIAAKTKVRAVTCTIDLRLPPENERS